MILIIQKQIALTITFIGISFLLAACSGKKNHQPKNQQMNQTAALNKADSKQYQSKENSKDGFTFTVNNKKYRATDNHSGYVGYNDYNALTLTVDSKVKGESLTLKIEIFTQKEGFKSTKYKLNIPPTVATVLSIIKMKVRMGHIIMETPKKVFV